jgi:hypothetical protein
LSLRPLSLRPLSLRPLSLRGAQRRGNLVVWGTVSGIAASLRSSQ